MASGNIRSAVGVGICFLIGGAVFAITLEAINFFQGQHVYPLVPIEKRTTGRLEMPVLTDSSPIAWNLKDQTGKVVVVNYFATWCGPCNDEEPELKRLYSDYNSRGVVFVAVGLDTDQDQTPNVPREKTLRQFALFHSLPFPILLPAQNTILPLQETPIPQTFVYDRHGRLARTIVGAITRQNLRASLDQLLAEN